MIDHERPVATHYSTTQLGNRILAALESMGKDLNALTPADLAPVDAFHIRGREATQELTQLAGINPGMQVLDVGCGIGGSARYLATELGCKVTGIDLTEEYCQVAAMLSDRLGLSDLTGFRQGSALELPFEAESFDLVWTEHAQMNVADKAGFYGEINRVLKRDGRLVFHDVFQGTGGDLHFPVPWAGDAAISFLIAPNDLQHLLRSQGFRQQHWQDMTSISLDWFHKTVETAKSAKPAPLGPRLSMGEDAGIKFANMLRNMVQNRVVVIQAALEKLPT